jgi:hypothetical protein
MSAAQLENLAANTPSTITLFHWGSLEYNNEWIQAFQTQQQLEAHCKHVSSVTAKQAQGIGFYATGKPDSYTVKQEESDELLVISLVQVPSIDATNNPQHGTALYNIAQTKEAIMAVVDQNGFPPKLLLKYGHSFYRLTTVAGVTVTANLSTVALPTVQLWKTNLWKQSDKNSFYAFKTQAAKYGIATVGW